MEKPPPKQGAHGSPQNADQGSSPCVPWVPCSGGRRRRDGPPLRSGPSAGVPFSRQARPLRLLAAHYEETPAYLQISLYVSSMLWCAVLRTTHLARRASL